MDLFLATALREPLFALIKSKVPVWQHFSLIRGRHTEVCTGMAGGWAANVPVVGGAGAYVGLELVCADGNIIGLDAVMRGLPTTTALLMGASLRSWACDARGR
ncbi:MAG: hypothetical protein HYX31_15685 [Mycobacterium sp.]|nr:hypothetical protein [Mycobacterium sp.]